MKVYHRIFKKKPLQLFFIAFIGVFDVDLAEGRAKRSSKALAPPPLGAFARG